LFAAGAGRAVDGDAPEVPTGLWARTTPGTSAKVRAVTMSVFITGILY
jgi:hypothetical protein